MNEGGIDYKKIIHNLLKGEIKVSKKVKKIENKYKEIEEERNGNDKIGTGGNARKW